jgi:PIN domain nuclease of toxin-antitoxin system
LLDENLNEPAFGYSYFTLVAGRPPDIGHKAKKAHRQPKESCFLSAAVIWEVMIKEALGKLDIPPDRHARPGI